MLNIILLIVAFAAFFIYIGLKPAAFTVVREANMKVSPEAIFPWINSSKKMNEWMPWSELDPKLVMNYKGPDEGVGSVSTWTSEGQMGVGSATIVESVPNQKVKTQLVYEKPFKAVQMAEVALNKSSAGSTVKWSVTGEHSNYMGKLMFTFINLDKMIGGSFEKGLAKLKTKVNG